MASILTNSSAMSALSTLRSEGRVSKVMFRTLVIE